MFGERMHNYPQGHSEGPHCPNSTLVEICNALAGNDTTPQNFCTEKMEDAVYSKGVISVLKEAKIVPAASCAMSNKILDLQLEIVKHKFELPSQEEILSKLDGAKTVDEKSKVMTAFEKAKANFDLRESIIENWRQVIFDTCCATTNDKENIHFRRFSSASELTEDEIINKVKSFKGALQEIIGYKKETFGWWDDKAEKCPQSPSRRHVGGL